MSFRSSETFRRQPTNRYDLSRDWCRLRQNLFIKVCAWMTPNPKWPEKDRIGIKKVGEALHYIMSFDYALGHNDIMLKSKGIIKDGEIDEMERDCNDIWDRLRVIKVTLGINDNEKKFIEEVGPHLRGLDEWPDLEFFWPDYATDPVRNIKLYNPGVKFYAKESRNFMIAIGSYFGHSPYLSRQGDGFTVPKRIPPELDGKESIIMEQRGAYIVKARDTYRHWLQETVQKLPDAERGVLQPEIEYLSLALVVINHAFGEMSYKDAPDSVWWKTATNKIELIAPLRNDIYDDDYDDDDYDDDDDDDEEEEEEEGENSEGAEGDDQCNFRDFITTESM